MRRKNKKSEEIANDNDTDTARDTGSAPARRAQLGSGTGPQAQAATPAVAAAEEVRRRPAPAAPAFEDADTAPAAAAAGSPGAAAGRTPDPALADLFERDPVEQPPPPPQGGDYAALDRLELPALLELRQQIDVRLPPRTLESVDLVEELMLQYHLAKALMTRVANDNATPANQKAQVINSCASVLEQVTKTQTALYTAERVKAMEHALEKAMQGVPFAVKEAFIDRYTALLAEAAQRKQEKKT